MEGGAVEQVDAADEAGASAGASPLICVLGGPNRTTGSYGEVRHVRAGLSCCYPTPGTTMATHWALRGACRRLATWK